jgi:hypothetical protein
MALFPKTFVRMKPRSEVIGALSPLIRVLLLCGAQALLMLALAATIVSSETLARWLYQEFPSWIQFIPSISKYSSAYRYLGREAEFPRIFATFVSFMAVQVCFIGIILFNVLRTSSWQLNFSVDFKSLLGAVVLFIMGLYPTVDLFVGLSNAVNDVYYSSIPTPFVYSVVIPAANFVLYLIIFANFGKSFSKILASNTAHTRY